MIELRPPAREPVFNIPTIVLVVILGLAAIHAVRTLALSDRTDLQILVDLAVIPARWVVALGAATLQDVVGALEAEGAANRSGLVAFARYVLGEGDVRPWTAITYAGLHGSWTHVILNSVWLAAFGTPVARRCGGARFVLLLAATAAGGAVAHVLVHPLQVMPLIGASASVSGLMAAAAWFMFAPRTWTLEGRIAEPHERHRESLAGMVRNRRVVLFLAIWLVTNFLSASLAQPLGMTDASIAWEAHVGGFLVGLLLFPALDPLGRRGQRAVRGPSPL